MRQIKLNDMLLAAMVVTLLLTSGCSISAYKQYLVSRAEYDQCVKQRGASHTQCISEREKLYGDAGAYEKEAKSNQWWSGGFADIRKQDPLSAYDRK